MLGVCVGFCMNGFRAILDLAGRDAGPYARLKLLVGRDYGPGRDDCPVRNDGMVHDNGTHSYDDIVADHAAMHIGPMPDRNVVPDDAFRLLIGRVQHGVVLNVDSVADADRSDVSAKHCAIPYAAVISDFHRSYDRRRLRQKRALSYDGPVALEFLDDSHELRSGTIGTRPYKYSEKCRTNPDLSCI